jgi:hypothetical protein
VLYPAELPVPPATLGPAREKATPGRAEPATETRRKSQEFFIRRDIAARNYRTQICVVGCVRAALRRKEML